MVDTILGRKLGMTQVFTETDDVCAVTVIEAGPCIVSQIKTVETDGYNAIQIGFGDIKEKKLNNPKKGHFEKHGVEPRKFLREVRLDNTEDFELGQKLTIADFEETDKVCVSGISKGKGFAGVIKRYNFGGGPGGHGSHFHRAPGSVGMCATPSRVLKGMKMPGHMGNEKVTVKNLKVVRVDADQNLLLVKGAVPGGKGALLKIVKA